MSEKMKCSISDDGRHVQPCSGLERECEFGNPRPKKRGIFCWAYHNMETGKPSRTFFGVVSTASPNGMIFNCCPFCGERIDAPVLTDEEKAAAA